MQCGMKDSEEAMRWISETTVKTHLHICFRDGKPTDSQISCDCRTALAPASDCELTQLWRERRWMFSLPPARVSILRVAGMDGRVAAYDLRQCLNCLSSCRLRSDIAQ